MKAKVNSTGEVVEVREVEIVNLRGGVTYRYRDVSNHRLYDSHELRFIDDDLDYWTKLEHQYAGMAMQAYIIASHISQFSFCENDMKDCKSMAHALVKNLKEKEE